MAVTPEMMSPSTTLPHGRGVAIAGLVLGISSIVIGWLPLLGLACAIVGLVMSVRGRRLGPYYGMSTTGLVLSIIGIVWSAGNSLLWVWMMSTGRHVFPPYGG